MNRAGSRQVVLVAMLVIAGSVALQSAQGKGGSFKQLWAIGLLGLILSLLADVTPEVAGPLAILIALAYVSGGSAAINRALGSQVTHK